jgi:hypothetical protein
MKKTVTKEIVACDLCINEEVQVWPCDKCGREVCRYCCFMYTVNRDRHASPNTMFATMTLNFSPHKAIFTANFCNDCAKNEIGTALLRAGFEEKQRDEQAA